MAFGGLGDGQTERLDARVPDNLARVRGGNAVDLRIDAPLSPLNRRVGTALSCPRVWCPVALNGGHDKAVPTLRG